MSITSATPATLPPRSSGLWIAVLWKTARYARRRLTRSRRRVSHNTLDAADGAHRLHRHFRRTLDQDVKIGSRRPVTLRRRREGTDRASSLRSDERSRSPIGVHVRRNRSRSPKYPIADKYTYNISRELVQAGDIWLFEAVPRSPSRRR